MGRFQISAETERDNKLQNPYLVMKAPDKDIDSLKERGAVAQAIAECRRGRRSFCLVGSG